MAKSLQEIVIDLYKGGKSPFEIHKITGARIEDVYAILKDKLDGNRS